MIETWHFVDKSKAATAREFIDYRHPSNMMEWIGDDTLNLEGPSETTRQWLRSLGARPVGPQTLKAEPGGSGFTRKPQ